ncbi:hypothetical protein N7453_012092 [Penicillium expansum]|nr:hypothetical protein N7453_012092 [Penicillium expansum]
MQFVRKAEEALTGKKDESHDSTKSSNHGPHSSKLANKLDPRVDSDKDHRAAHTDVTGAGLGSTHGTTTATGTHGTTHGTSGVTGGGAGLGSYTRSNIANKADPRVDSDRDNRAAHTGVTGAGLGSTHAPTTTTGTHGSTLGSGTTHGTSGVTATGAGLGSTHGTTGSTNAGPHSSNIANKADPRVDSDRDNRARHEGLTGATPGAGLGSTHATHGSPWALALLTAPLVTNVGPHSSNIANKADPRVDSDRDNRARHEGLTGATTGAGLGSTHGTTTTTGTHGSTLGSGTAAAPMLDLTAPTSLTSSTPRVDSDRDSNAQHSSLSGTGPGTTTHGTHSRGATAAPTGSAIGGSGLGTTGHHDALAGSSYNTPATGTTTGATGTTAPHSSSIANKLDPRVDTDATHAQSGLHRQI